MLICTVLSTFLAVELRPQPEALLLFDELDAYASAGIKTDHECSVVEEMTEKISKGIWCLLSEKFYFLFLPANSESKDVCEVFPEIPYSVGPEKTDSPCFQVVQRFCLFRKA